MVRGGGKVLAGSMVTSTSGPSVSWIAIFGLLDSWAVSAANRRSQAQAQPLGLSAPFGSSFPNLAASQTTSQQFIIGPKTVLLPQSFLRVLSHIPLLSVPRYVDTLISGPSPLCFLLSP
jgi:nuclear pore complex protein Nup205